MRALLVLAALLATGCIEPSPPAEPGSGAMRAGGDVPEGGGSLACAGIGEWTQPELYGLLPALDGRPSVEVTERAADDGVPFDGSALGRPHANLTFFARAVERTTLFLAVDPKEGLVLAGMVAPELDEEGARGLFEAFAGRVTTANESTRAAWFESWWASRKPGLLSAHPGQAERIEQYSLTVPVEPALVAVEPAWRDLGEPEAQEVGRNVWLSWRTDEARWEARLSWPERRLEAVFQEGALVLVVNAAGDVSAYADDVRWDTEEDAKRYVAAGMREVGLPEPTFEGWTEDRSIC